VVAAFLVSFLLIAHRLPFNATTQLVPFNVKQLDYGYAPSIIKYDYYMVN
jgi:hypothetical protein